MSLAKPVDSTVPPTPIQSSASPSVLLGLVSGVVAALLWAGGLVAARHGIAAGLTPADLAFHRFVWAGAALLPVLLVQDRARNLGGIGWKRGSLITLFGGPMLGLLSYSGFLTVPLGHGGVIQPSTAAVSGIALSVLILKEKLPIARALGTAAIVSGLVVIGGEAVTTIGLHGLLGDLAFAGAGLSFAIFAMLLRLWRVTPVRAVTVVSVISLLYVPVQWLAFGFDNMISLGWAENILQAVVQSALVGAVSTYLFARAVVLLGPSRAAMFPSLVPPFTLLLGFVLLGEVPTWPQLGGMLIVVIGFRLTQRS
jgi:drug/metabolite transporter (DMT)-like permease